MAGLEITSADIDTVLSWSVMQKFMDELSETEEEASGSSDDMVSVGDALSDHGTGVSRADSVSSASGLAALTSTFRAGALGADSLLPGSLSGIRPILDPRHLLNAARAEPKMSSHISTLLQGRSEAESAGRDELSQFLPPLLFGSRPFQRTHSGSRLYGRPGSPLQRDDEQSDDGDQWGDAPTGAGGKVRRGAGDEKGTGKVRFVWSAELHARFEQAVAKLGVDRAKPQAISQLMGIEGDNAPTRQNIKSHLQKYRLLVKKRAAQAAGELPPPPPNKLGGVIVGSTHPITAPPPRPDAFSAGVGAGGVGGMFAAAGGGGAC